MNPDSPAEIRGVLEQRGLTLKKRWGQNFLVNRNAREKLVALLEPQTGDTVWEIGPGLGSMTTLLLAKAKRLVAFEVDRGLCRFLSETYEGSPSFTLVQGDFIETWQTVFAQSGPPDRLLGNLPYRSASLMIAAMIEGGVRPLVGVFTVQRELAERMEARPGTKSYSSFSVLCQSSFTVEGRGDLKPGNFYPAPEVVSSIVEMRPRGDAPAGPALRALSALARGLFSSRRKTLRNNVDAAALGMVVSADSILRALEAEGIDPGQRAEEIPPETFARLARALTAPSSP